MAVQLHASSLPGLSCGASVKFVPELSCGFKGRRHFPDVKAVAREVRISTKSTLVVELRGKPSLHRDAVSRSAGVEEPPSLDSGRTGFGESVLSLFQSSKPREPSLNRNSSNNSSAAVAEEPPLDHRRTGFPELSNSGPAGFGEILRRFFEHGDWSGCAQLLEAGCWRRRVSGAAFLWSSAVVTAPSLASSSSVPGAVVVSAALPASDFVAAAATLVGALGILHFFDELAKRDLLEKKLSRKLCHILSGMVFMLFWPLFSAAPLAKYMAALAPAANGLRMIGLGLGLWKNEALVKAISREGDQRELLQGPLYYAITITVATLFFWRNSPVGACAVATLCAGDGFADIVGRRWGKQKLPYNSSKSILGSVAFFVTASLACMGYVAYFAAFGYFTATPIAYAASIAVALVSAIVESLPLPLDDNFSVPFTAIGVGMLLLPF